jgi:hypothetical protein
MRMLLRRRTTAIGAALAAFALAHPAPAGAWGATGHRLPGEAAILALPDDAPAFLRGPEIAQEIGELSREADRSRDSGAPHDPDLNPSHFVSVGDDLLIGGGVSLRDLPPARAEYDAALRAAGADPYKVGFLPYAIQDGWQQLVKDLAYWRADVAGAAHAKTDAEQLWFERDRLLHERLTLRDLGYWAHFVEDASQPMHVSVHRDGWGDYPNPEGFPTTPGLHARFEGAFVRANVQWAEIAALIPPYRPRDGAIRAWTIDYLVATQSQAPPLYALAKRQPFYRPETAQKAFVVERLAAGATELRDLVMEAWRASAAASVGYPAVKVKDVEAGIADPLGPMQGLD